MAEATGTSFNLPGRIREKRAQVDRYLAKALPRKRRLLNATLLGGALAALLTAGPALGGKTFSAWLSEVFGLHSPAWQLLCGAAALCSLTAAISTQLLKSHGLEENLARAQLCSTKLELLELGLAAGQLDGAQALAEYGKCVEAAAFLQGEAPGKNP